MDGSERIRARLEASGVSFTIHEHATSRTYAEALDRLPFPPEQLLKIVAFVVGPDDWILVGLRGADRVDYRALADALGVRRADLRQAPPDEVAAKLGVEVGGVSPVPPIAGVRVVVDEAARELETVFTGAGRAELTLEIRLDDLLRVTGAEVRPVGRRALRDV
jgi:Cys-tRNA(Pro)/Cys-tRNA(Cys) deacylase